VLRYHGTAVLRSGQYDLVETDDLTADLTLVSTILLAVLVLTLVQVGDMARRARNGEHAGLVMRFSSAHSC